MGLWKRSLSKLHKYFLFLGHKYGVEHFSVVHAKENMIVIANLDPTDGLDSDSSGKLRPLKTPSQKGFFAFKNALFFGAYQYRVEQSVYFTFMAYCIEIYNPTNRKILIEFVERKVHMLETLLGKVKLINRKKWPIVAARINIDLFRRSSYVQEKVIERMHTCLHNQSEPEIVKEAKRALYKGLHPILVIQGLSGTYWMRGVNRETLGLFKPFDEEAYAPNNPCGPELQGALGKRRMRSGIRVGESTLREVAAYVVDQFFGFGIVPKTYFATFTHHVFFHAQTQWKAPITSLRRIEKEKIGSFQEYIEGFATLGDTAKEMWKEIPTIEYQLLLVLDVILGNLDRNTGNILVGEEKIAAIDHGLTLPDINVGLSTWYWRGLEQGKEPLFPPLLKLFEEFPFEKLFQRLRKRCCIDAPALQRMKERVILFREGLKLGKTPFELAGLFSDENLSQLVDLDISLPEKAHLIVLSHLEKKKEKEQDGQDSQDG